MSDRFKWLKTDIIYQEERGGELRWIVTKELIQDKETSTTFSRSLLHHPGVSAIVAINDKQEILLIEQFRYTFRASMWEIPTGTLHGELKDGRVVAIESPKVAAERELAEETGYKAARLQEVSSFAVMPGTSDGLVYLFLAFDLSLKPSNTDIGEVISKIQFFSINEALTMVAQGQICDAKTIIGIYTAKNYLENL